MISAKESVIKVADECWIALALLTKEKGIQSSFTARQILDRIRQEGLHPVVRPGVLAHIHLHNVANLPPNTARYRMFYRLEDGTYRLFRPGDPHHPERTGKLHPSRDETPVEYRRLIDWYDSGCGAGKTKREPEEDPILKMIGLGKDLWAGIDPDQFVEDLRSGWGSVVLGEPPPRSRGTSVWERVVRHQGDEFQTVRGLPFTYEVQGTSGIWFYRKGHRINRRLARSELESALRKSPLHSPADLKEFQDPSYLFGLLTDPRIIGCAE